MPFYDSNTTEGGYRPSAHAPSDGLDGYDAWKTTLPPEFDDNLDEDEEDDDEEDEEEAWDDEEDDDPEDEDEDEDDDEEPGDPPLRCSR